jgi:ribosomal protein L11 methyltransferase
VLDVGTGSGVLAIAASRLGAARVLGIDHDPDALQAARDNLALNPGAAVTFELGHAEKTLPPADVVTANLTGALLRRLAPSLSRARTLIVSGLLAEEQADVVSAFGTMKIMWQASEDGWIALSLVGK